MRSVSRRRTVAEPIKQLLRVIEILVREIQDPKLKASQQHPPVTAGILESITRSTLIDLFEREFEIVVQEREIDRTELYVAEEVFLCGSGWELLPITSVDRLAIGSGSPGPLTRKIQDAYFSIVRGENAVYREWLTPVYSAARQPAGMR